MQGDAPRSIVQPFDQGTVKDKTKPGFYGAGALGRACLERLLPFDVPLTAVDLHPRQWRHEELGQRISLMVQGDLRQARVLERAGIRHG